jgi:hypothetical protein
MRHYRFSNYHSLLYSALNNSSDQHEQLLEEIVDFKKNATGLNEQEKLICLHNYGLKLEESRIVVTLLSCSFIEALANFYISLKCKSEQFKILERVGLLDKWTAVPSLFIPEYHFPKNSELYRDLKMLNDTRNRISHSKPEIVTDGQVTHEGFLPKIPKSSRAFAETITSLPLRLVKHLSAFDKSEDVTTLLMTSGLH